jgi:hypothetical protein
MTDVRKPKEPDPAKPFAKEGGEHDFAAETGKPDARDGAGHDEPSSGLNQSGTQAGGQEP